MTDDDPARTPTDAEKTDRIDDPARQYLRNVRDAAHALADAVHSALDGTARVQLPRLAGLQVPRLFAPLGAAVDLDAEEPDKRHLVVSVRTVPVLGEPTETHTYRDAGGLTWQTYGEEHNFGTDRLLEIQNEDGDAVATYPPGTWLHVRYEQYADNTGATP